MIFLTSLPNFGEPTQVLAFITLVVSGATVYLFKMWMDDRVREIKELQKFQQTLLSRLVKKFVVDELEGEGEDKKG